MVIIVAEVERPSAWPRDIWLDAIWDCLDIKPNERVVAYAYARYAGASDVTWCAWDELKRRTGIRSREALSRAISGLVGAGWLVEVERARQHYSTRYRLAVPRQQFVSRTPEAQQSVSRTAATAEQFVSRTAGSVSSSFNEPDLSNGSLQQRDPPPHTRGIKAFAAAVGATEEEMTLLIEKTRKDQPHVKSPLAWLRRCHDNGDLSAMLDEVRARPSPQLAVVPERCGECDARYDSDPMSARVVWLADGRSVHCPRCHPLRRAAS